jgi:hypothetical protein
MAGMRRWDLWKLSERVLGGAWHSRDSDPTWGARVLRLMHLLRGETNTAITGT